MHCWNSDARWIERRCLCSGGNPRRRRLRLNRARDRGDGCWCCRAHGSRSWCAGHRRWMRRCCVHGRGGTRLRPLCVLRVGGSCRGSTRPQLLAGRFSGPCPRVDVTNHTEPLFGFGECGEVAHVEPETLATFLEAATHEEGEALQFRQVDLGKRHWRGRRAEIQDERARFGLRCRRLPSFRAPRRARGHIWRW